MLKLSGQMYDEDDNHNAFNGTAAKLDVRFEFYINRIAVVHPVDDLIRVFDGHGRTVGLVLSSVVAVMGDI
jgi:hypothetical protein